MDVGLGKFNLEVKGRVCWGDQREKGGIESMVSVGGDKAAWMWQ